MFLGTPRLPENSSNRVTPLKASRTMGTVALDATTSYLASHHAGPLAPALAATHGYAVAFGVSAAVFGTGALIAFLLLPARRRLDQLPGRPRRAPAATAEAASPGVAAGAESCQYFAGQAQS